MTAKADEINVKLVSQEHGFDDYDVTNLPGVRRACIGHGIKNGDVFNVYCDNGVKLGATWRGEVNQSLVHFAATHAQYRERFVDKQSQSPAMAM